MHRCPYLIFLICLFFKIQTHAQQFSHLKQLQANGLEVSARVLNLNTGKVLADISSTKRITPASVSKLILGADALETWGPFKTFSTKYNTKKKHV